MRFPGSDGNGTIKRYRMRLVNGKLRLVHRLRAEAALGKPLPPGAVVHHADGTKSEYAPLVICEDEAYHQLLHFRMRLRAAGADPNTERVCTYCHEVKPLSAFMPHCARSGKWHCSGCPGKRAKNNARRALRRTQGGQAQCHASPVS